MMIDLQPVTEEVLTAAGWSPGRKWPAFQAVRGQLHAQGYETVPVAAEFIAEFGGLTIHHRSIGGPPTTTEFDPVKASGHLDASWLRVYEQRSKTHLFAVGEAYDGHMTVLVGEDGRVFLGFDDDLQCIGDDRYDALNWLCMGPEHHAERARRHLTT